MDRVAQKSTVAIEESEVDTPTVDTNRVEPSDAPPSSSQTVEDGAVERQSVPVQHAVDSYGPIPEPRQLLQMELLVPHYSQDHSAA